MSGRNELVRGIEQRLGRRKLYWIGTRGDDARSLMDIPQFSGSFSFINSYSHHTLGSNVALEDITGERMDLDDWDIDDHLHGEAVQEFRQIILHAMTAENAVITYRPTQFLSALTFARRDLTQYLGMYVGQQHVFEHKPWVEVSVQDLGWDAVPWRYIADEEQLNAANLLRDGAVVVRPSRGSGGTGMARITNADELQKLWQHGEDFFMSVSPYLENCMSINIGAVVWRGGGASLSIILQYS